MRIIKFPFKFVSETKLKDEGGEDMRLGDPDVKEIKCKSIEWRNEFLIILTEIWADIKDVKELKMPETVKESTGSYMNENNPLKDWLDEYFIKTKDDKDTMTQKELKEFYASDTGKDITDRSFKNLMEFNGFKYKRKEIGAGFCFIQRNPEKEKASGPL
jgi:phage/plasmid-associated DNA primase